MSASTSSRFRAPAATAAGVCFDRASVRACFAGADPFSRNLGVVALFLSSVAGLAEWLDLDVLHVFDYGRGVRWASFPARGGEVRCRVSGANHSRRLHSPDSLWNLRMAVRLGGLRNPGARALLGADAVLDISGGDSFSDIYGWWRYRSVAGPKHLAMAARRPLVLLPQTYGPYLSRRARRDAERIVRYAGMAWARDARSFEVLRELAGEEFDPTRYRCGVDVAFALPVREPSLDGASLASRWLLGEGTGPLLGFNISGLIYNDPDRARSQFGLKTDYRGAVLTFLSCVLERTEARVLLVPHVVVPAGSIESDVAAAEDVCRRLSERHEGRVATAPLPAGPGEAKWMIARCDWFCGTRMHATIAALSSGVPVAAIAYSNKTRGVFDTCGVGEAVVDPRAHVTAESVERLLELFGRRHELATTMAARLPAVKAQAAQQMSEIAAFVRASAHQAA